MNVEILLSEKGHRLLFGRASEQTDIQRRILREESHIVIPEFLSERGVNVLLSEFVSVRAAGYRCETQVPVFAGGSPNSLKAPWHRESPQSLLVVAADRLTEGSPLLRLSRDGQFRKLLRELLGLPVLYDYADELGEANYVEMSNGDVVPWHFDTSDFTIGLTLTMPNAGGEFEIAPGTLHWDEPGLSRLDAILTGDHRGVLQPTTPSGSLVIFRGREAMHRVRTVKGPVCRVNALLGYAAAPDGEASPKIRSFRYGRKD